MAPFKKLNTGYLIGGRPLCYQPLKARRLLWQMPKQKSCRKKDNVRNEIEQVFFIKSVMFFYKEMELTFQMTHVYVFVSLSKQLRIKNLW